MADRTESEVRTAVKTVIRNLKVVAEKNAGAAVDADDFNRLLGQAKVAFPSSPTIAQMPEIPGATNLGTLMLKLSVLEGAMDAEMGRRIDEEGRRLTRG